MSELNPHWHGMLCAETADHIVALMNDLLRDRYFTVVQCNSYDENSDRFTAIDVTTSERLKLPGVRRHGDDGRTSVQWSAHRWSMGVGTNATTQAEARENGPHEYVHFTCNATQIVIDHYAPARYRLRWILAPEWHEEDDR